MTAFGQAWWQRLCLNVSGHFGTCRRTGCGYKSIVMPTRLLGVPDLICRAKRHKSALSGRPRTCLVFRRDGFVGSTNVDLTAVAANIVSVFSYCPFFFRR